MTEHQAEELIRVLRDIRNRLTLLLLLTGLTIAGLLLLVIALVGTFFLLDLIDW